MPVITLVVYYGEKPWYGALSLHDMLHIPEEIKAFVKSAGMEFLFALDADTHKPPGKCSERIYVAAREQGKQKEIV